MNISAKSDTLGVDDNNCPDVAADAVPPSDDGLQVPAELRPSLAHRGALLLQVSSAVVLAVSGSEDFRVLSSYEFDDQTALIDLVKDIAKLANSIREPVVFSSISEVDDNLAQRLSSLQIESIACVSEQGGGDYSGIFIAISREVRFYSETDLEIMRLLATQAAGEAELEEADPSSVRATSHNVLFDLANRKILELSAVNKVSRAVSSTLDIEKIYEIALKNGIEAVNADGGSLMILDPSTKHLHVVAYKGISEKYALNSGTEVGKGIAGYVAKSTTSVLVTDARKDERFSMRGYRDDINSSASVPLISRGQVKGVLNVNTTKKSRFFDKRDLELLETVAYQIAVAIENGSLHSRIIRRTSQLDSLLKISKIISSSLNLDVVMRRICTEICTIFDMQACALLLVDNINERFKYGYGLGLRTKEKHLYMDLVMPLASRVKKKNSRIMKSDISENKMFSSHISQEYGFKAAVSLPLKYAGKLVAVVTAFSINSNVYPRSVKDMAKSLPDLAGTAIYNAGVYHKKTKIAQLIQSRLVPSHVEVAERVEVGLKFVPAGEVGGDYCDFVICDDDQFAVVMGDVSGSDVDAAEYTLMGKHVTRAYAKSSASASDVLDRANQHIFEDSEPEVFICTFFGRVNLTTMTLNYATAGCEPGLLYKADTGEIIELKTGGIVLGLFVEALYREETIEIASGDILVLVTDGITEAGAGTDRFGIEGVSEVLSGCDKLLAQTIAERIYSRAKKMVNDFSIDDMGILVIRFP